MLRLRYLAVCDICKSQKELPNEKMYKEHMVDIAYTYKEGYKDVEPLYPPEHMQVPMFLCTQCYDKHHTKQICGCKGKFAASTYWFSGDKENLG